MLGGAEIDGEVKNAASDNETTWQVRAKDWRRVPDVY